MTRPTVVVLCVHGEAKPHGWTNWPGVGPACPGGRVLEQAIIIERDDGLYLALARLVDAVADFDQALENDLADDGDEVISWAQEVRSQFLDALASAQEQT